MVLKCLGSGSSGNCYLLEASDGVLIIEAGIPAIEIKKALRFQLKQVLGCVISHEHRDHSRSLKDILSYGIKVLALPQVFDSHNLRNRVFCKEVQPMHGYQVGGFKIFCLSVAHDVPCLGFVIEHKEMGRLLFVTDTMMLEYRLPKLNHIMLEANYADDILLQNIESGIVPHSMKDRLLHSHMEIETTKGILMANDLSEVSEIILIHLSGNNSDAERFRKEIKAVSGKPTYIARRGLEIDLSSIPY